MPRSGPTVEEKKKIFLNNRRMVEEINKNNKDYKLEVNEFSILTFGEFVETKTGLLPGEGQNNFSQPAPPSDRRGRAAAPESFDWTKTPNVVRPVQNQVIWNFFKHQNGVNILSVNLGKLWLLLGFCCNWSNRRTNDT